MCVTRQIITAIKTAARNKHTPLNTYVSFSHSRAGASADQEMSLAEILPDDPAWDPINQAISSEELRSLIGCLGETLSPLESGVLTMPSRAAPTRRSPAASTALPKTVDNALQRVKRKVIVHLRSREVADLR